MLSLPPPCSPQAPRWGGEGRAWESTTSCQVAARLCCAAVGGGEKSIKENGAGWGPSADATGMVRVQEGRRPRARRRLLLPVGRVPGAWSGCSAGWLHGGAHLLPRVYFRRQHFFFRPRGYEAAWRCQEGGGVGPPSFTRSPAGSPLFNFAPVVGAKGEGGAFSFCYRSSERSSGIGGCLYHAFFVFFFCFCFLFAAWLI